MEDAGNPWRPEALPPLPSAAAAAAANGVWPPEIPWDPMEFLSRSWSVSAMEVSKAMAPPAGGACGFLLGGGGAIPEEEVSADLELERSMAALTANPPAPFATSATSQLIMERIMSHPGAQQEVSQLTSGRLSHSSGHLNGAGSLSDSPPVSPSNADDVNKYCAAVATVKPQYRGGSKTVGRWLKDRRERKKEEARAQNAQLHATVSVAGVAAAIAAIAAATAAATSQGTAAGKDEQAAKIDMVVASAATLVAAHCVEAAEAMGAEREHLASVVGSAVNVRTPGDIVTLTAAAATALRGAATLKARALKEVWNVAAVVPVEKGGVAGHDQRRHHQQQKEQQQVDEKDPGSSGELLGEDDFLGLCSQELLAKGTELLKRTRKGALHWKTVSVYLNKTGQVMLKMKSRYAAGTITKKKKNVVADVCKDISAWPGRHLLEGGERRRYFGLKTTERGVIEFECRSQRDYEIWTQGVARLLDIAAGRR